MLVLLAYTFLFVGSLLVVCGFHHRDSILVDWPTGWRWVFIVLGAGFMALLQLLVVFVVVVAWRLLV